MRKLLLLLITTFLFSCSDIQYDGEKRLVFQTQMLDVNNEPLSNSHVEITTRVEYASDLISKGKTDQNGKITLIFPAPKNDFKIDLKIFNYDTSYMQREVLNIDETEFVNYKFIYQNTNLLKIDEVVPLNLTYNQANFNIILKKVSIIGIYHLDSEYFTFSENNYYENPSQFLLKKNQTFQLKYTLRNTQTNVETNYLVALQIGNDALNYTLNY